MDLSRFHSSGDRPNGSKTTTTGCCDCGFKHWYNGQEYDWAFNPVQVDLGDQFDTFLAFNLDDDPVTIGNQWFQKVSQYSDFFDMSSTRPEFAIQAICMRIAMALQMHPELQAQGRGKAALELITSIRGENPFEQETLQQHHALPPPTSGGPPRAHNTEKPKTALQIQLEKMYSRPGTNKDLCIQQIELLEKLCINLKKDFCRSKISKKFICQTRVSRLFGNFQA